MSTDVMSVKSTASCAVNIIDSTQTKFVTTSGAFLKKLIG